MITTSLIIQHVHMFLAHLLLYSTGTVAKDAEDDTFIKEGKDNQYGD